jgi:DNA polymerase I
VATSSTKVGILTGRYRADESDTTPTTIIDLFGRTIEGKSVVVSVTGLQPTFEFSPLFVTSMDSITAETSKLIEGVKGMEHVEEVTGPVMKWTEVGMRPVWTVRATQPFHVPTLRNALQTKNFETYSSDIPFVNRLFLDLDLSMHIQIDAEPVMTHDFRVDVAFEVGLGEIRTCDPFPVPFTVCSFDLETSIENNTILCGAAWTEHYSTGRREQKSFVGNEIDIMKQITAYILETDPDIITGYNIDNFDLPRIKERMLHHSKKDDWEHQAALFGWGRCALNENEANRNRDGLLPQRRSNRSWTVCGRIFMDAWWQARQALRPKRETLSFVAKLLFPDDEEKHKMDIDASKMDEEWEKRPQEVIDYCVRDAELPLDILNEIQAIRRTEALASVARVVMDTAANGSTSQLIDSLVIRLADQKMVAVPQTGSAEPKEGQIAGGYVHDVDAGLYPWVAVLDFKSMYPSIMIGKNICYTTRIEPSQFEQPFPPHHQAPTGALFLKSEEKRGLVPQLLEGLMAKRDEHKSALKIAKQEHDAPAEGFHDAMQYAVKILMNSFYGVFASGFYRFTHRDLGSSITAWARQNIKAVITSLEDEGHNVVYSDTDSIFVQVPELQGTAYFSADPDVPLDLEQPTKTMFNFGTQLAKRFSQDSAVLEFEKGLSVFFSHGAKKRYLGQVIWPNEEMLVRGYETQRTDSFQFLIESMNQLFQYVLKDQGEELVAFAIHQVQSLKQNTVKVSDLILSKSCKGKVLRNPVTTLEDVDFDAEYANPDSMAQVRVARQMIERGLGFTSGMKVAYIVTDGSKSPVNVVPWWDEEIDMPSYDGDYYAERLATALGRITEAFGWTAKELMQGNRQSSLFSF